MTALDLGPATAGALALAEGLWLVGGPGLTGEHDALAYLIDCGDGQAVLVDCGTNADRLLRNVAVAGFLPGAILGVLATHGHVDHLSAAPALLEAGCGDVWLHEAEAPAVRAGDPVLTCAYLYGGPPVPVPVAHELTGDGLLRFGARTLEVVATPGHSPGSVSYLVECAGTRVALLGDALWGGYHPRIGSDLGEWEQTLTRLRTLDCDALSFGHGPPRLVAPYKAKIAYAQQRFGFLCNPWGMPAGGTDAWVPERPGLPGPGSDSAR
jgi:glyoxylase-like metal-dependent hydrolase (beta-lactamase superfamily II)